MSDTAAIGSLYGYEKRSSGQPRDRQKCVRQQKPAIASEPKKSKQLRALSGPKEVYDHYEEENTITREPQSTHVLRLDFVALPATAYHLPAIFGAARTRRSSDCRRQDRVARRRGGRDLRRS
jgi:hypothetical protein